MNMPADDLANLYSRAVSALRDLPGAVALSAFGSLATGSGDSFSDIDLEVVTTDLENALGARHSVWERIGVPLLEWRIYPSQSDWAATLLFEGVSPYHKLDIGINQQGNGKQSAPFAAESILLWRQESMDGPLRKNALQPYQPAVTTPDHVVIGHLLGATRYVKARKRGQHLTCFRFASALANAVLSLLHAGLSGDPADVGRTVGTPGYLGMDASLPEDTRLGLLAEMDFSSPSQMDRTVCDLSRRCLDLLDSVPGAGALPEAVTGHLLGFIESELECSGHWP